MDPAEVEFIAEKDVITIVPNFQLEKIFLISGDIGPFSPGLPIDVPLWMAVNLKQRQKARIRPPEWMDVEKLQEKKQEETDSKFFTEMPCKCYMEMTTLLLKYIDTFVKSDATHAKLNHLTLMELNTVRPFLTKALDQLHVLRMNMSSRGTQLTQD
ncbi:PSF2-like protein [Mya arenaria]|uniref:PSF2-like protein n=1 Tax=Mya arenaria TaxID=6604 RepID=A0ABY7ERV2_MYAAR|nr:PSF2-like protein [Mya arenaria]